MAAVLLGCALAVGVFALVFDWNWLRGPLERYLSEKSGRAVRIADLHVTPGLEPTVRLRGVYVENAPWAARRPMAVAREVSFTFGLSSIWQERPVISHLVLMDAEVDLERQANGLRNWRLTRPQDNSPGRVRVRVLEHHRSQVRFVNREADLELIGTSTPLKEEKPGPQGVTLSSTITLQGEYRGAAFSGTALSGSLMSFRDSNHQFPLRGHLASGKTRLEFDGMFADLYDLGPMDADLRLAGATLSDLYPFIPLHPVPSRPYGLAAWVTQRDDIYRIAGLRGKVGDTDLAGDASYDRSRDRPLVHAVLRSERADLVDLAALAGVQQFAGRDTSNRIFPARPFRVDGLKTFDAAVTLDARQLKAAALPMVESLRIDAALTGGVVETKAFALGVAGGRVAGGITFDTQREPPSARVALDAVGIRLEKLLSTLSPATRLAGAISGRLNLKGSGRSLAALIVNATGSLHAQLDGGRISRALDAKLGLSPGKVLGAWLRGNPDLTVNCAVMAFDVRNGMGKARTLTLDTEQTHVKGAGSVDLRNEQVDLLLTPDSKEPGIFTRQGAIRIRGPFRKLSMSVEKRTEAASVASGTARDAACG